MLLWFGLQPAAGGSSFHHVRCANPRRVCGFPQHLYRSFVTRLIPEWRWSLRRAKTRGVRRARIGPAAVLNLTFNRRLTSLFSNRAPLYKGSVGCNFSLVLFKLTNLPHEVDAATSSDCSLILSSILFLHSMLNASVSCLKFSA